MRSCPLAADIKPRPKPFGHPLQAAYAATQMPTAPSVSSVDASSDSLLVCYRKSIFESRNSGRRLIKFRKMQEVPSELSAAILHCHTQTLRRMHHSVPSDI